MCPGCELKVAPCDILCIGNNIWLAFDPSNWLGLGWAEYVIWLGYAFVDAIGVPIHGLYMDWLGGPIVPKIGWVFCQGLVLWG